MIEEGMPSGMDRDKRVAKGLRLPAAPAHFHSSQLSEADVRLFGGCIVSLARSADTNLLHMQRF